MIDNLKLIFKEDILATYELNGKESKFPLEAIRKYWDYANEADLEGAKLYTDDNNVVALLTTASDQGGVVVIWDAASEEITHISDASLTVDVDKYIINIKDKEFVVNR